MGHSPSSEAYNCSGIRKNLCFVNNSSQHVRTLRKINQVSAMPFYFFDIETNIK